MQLLKGVIVFVQMYSTESELVFEKLKEEIEKTFPSFFYGVRCGERKSVNG